MEGHSFKLEASYCRPGCQTLSVARSHREVEVLEPDQGDVRLTAAGAEPVAWAERDVLTIAVRQSGKAPSVVGTVSGSNAATVGTQ